MCTFFVRKILLSLFPAGQNIVLRMIFHLIWFVFVLSSFSGFKIIETMNIDEQMTFYVLTVYKKEFICSLIF